MGGDGGDEVRIIQQSTFPKMTYLLFFISANHSWRKATVPQILFHLTITLAAFLSFYHLATFRLHLHFHLRLHFHFHLRLHFHLHLQFRLLLSRLKKIRQDSFASFRLLSLLPARRKYGRILHLFTSSFSSPKKIRLDPSPPSSPLLPLPPSLSPLPPSPSPPHSRLKGTEAGFHHNFFLFIFPGYF